MTAETNRGAAACARRAGLSNRASCPRACSATSCATRPRYVRRGELDDLSNRVVVDAVDYRDNERDLDTNLREVFNRTHFYVEQVADAAMLVLFFTDAVELKIHTVLAGSFGSLAEFNVLGEANSVGRGKDAIEANFLGVSNGFEIVRRKCRLATREKNDDLPPRLE